MAFKLTKEEQKARDAHLVELQEKWQDIEQAVEKGREAINEAFAHVCSAISAYNEARNAADTWREEVASRLRGEYDDKSETWQESDRGQEVSAFVDEWENIENSEVDEPEIPDLDLPDGEYHNNLEALPSEV